MARADAAMLLQHFSGQIGKQVCLKQYPDKTVISAYPDMPKRKATRLQALYQERFRQAHKYAQSVMNDPVLSAKYEANLPPGKRAYNAAVSDYLKREKEMKSPTLPDSKTAEAPKSPAKVKSIKTPVKNKSKKGNKSPAPPKNKTSKKTAKKVKKHG